MSAHAVNLTLYEEGLGRVMYVAGALEHERLFLGSLYRFSTTWMVKSRSVVTLAQSRCARGLPPHESNTQASESHTGVRGRHPVLDSQGRLDPWLSPCISLNSTVNLVNGCSQSPISRARGLGYGH